ncbi:D-2-hydroxyacid dehydrogenase [Caldalkalibacillus mannanilyticus]|uniref:D-2-hydroxyacid dehydrogenase n=1 Tax=Caldalkalibacillus mannanilyticus TaxID=1418 RepID=UPI000469DE52|nr:D-2-hydroxyacid dehydrogenase [Caldalkalibacillus mannanilyticus]
MNITSTAKMSEKHQHRIKELYPDHEYFFYDKLSTVEREVLAKTEILLTYGEDLTGAIIDQMPRLKWIQVLSAGLELMPFESLLKRDILVTNARGIHRIPMAEYTMGMILQMTRKSIELFQFQKQGVWDRSLRVDEVYGKTLGIVGAGAIGSEIAKRAKVFGMKVIGLRREKKQESSDFDEMVTFEERETLFRQSDFVVVLFPATPETIYCIGEKELSQMKPSAYLMNIARGKIVQEGALLKALQEKRIAGAILDVFEQEPLPADHPFWQLDNVILTPHLSGRSPYYMQRALDIFIENLAHYPNASNMMNPIDLRKGY